MSRERGQDWGEVGGGKVVRLLGLGGGRRKKKRGTEKAGTSSRRTAPETEERERRQRRWRQGGSSVTKQFNRHLFRRLVFYETVKILHRSSGLRLCGARALLGPRVQGAGTNSQASPRRTRGRRPRRPRRADGPGPRSSVQAIRRGMRTPLRGLWAATVTGASGGWSRRVRDRERDGGHG